MRAYLFPLILALFLSGCLGASHATDPTALQVPLLAPAPDLDTKIGPGEWDHTLAIQGSFIIHDGTLANGAYPFELKLGHDAKWLFALARVHVPMPNPFDNGTRHAAWHLDMNLDSALGKDLVPPEASIAFSNLPIAGYSSTDEGYWNGSDWVTQNEGSDPQHLSWNGNHPGSGTWGRGWAEGNDLLWEIYIPLHSPNTAHDGFQADPGSIFRLGLYFQVDGTTSPDAHGQFTQPHGTYPATGYAPNNMYDPSTWLRLQLA
jgi:hypothetical protein